MKNSNGGRSLASEQQEMAAARGVPLSVTPETPAPSCPDLNHLQYLRLREVASANHRRLQNWLDRNKTSKK